MTEKYGEILPPERGSVPRRPFETPAMPPPNVGGLVTKWFYHFQSQTIRKQEEMWDSLVGLYKAQQGAISARIALERAAVSLEFLDDLRELEREKIRAEMAWERAQLRVKSDAIMSELAKSASDLHKAKELAERIINPLPPQEKPAKPDPTSEKINTALHGGRYSREAEASIQAYIRERGGESNLTEEDHERIRNTRQVAAQADYGQR